MRLPWGDGTVIEQEFKVYWRGLTVLSAGHQNARGGATGKVVYEPESNSKYVLVNWLSAHRTILNRMIQDRKLESYFVEI
ncbi:MAG: hypothetical protein WBA93_14190 [Microcoleaceae cyanobacterium]